MFNVQAFILSDSAVHMRPLSRNLIFPIRCLRNAFLPNTPCVTTAIAHSVRGITLLVKLSRGKTVPLQAWSGPEGYKKLWFLDYMTTAQDGGKVVSLTHRPPLPPGNAPGTNFC
jgi:hypothetical protein